MSRGKYRNLIIIGNGFDRWLGMPTSYDNFRKYYAENAVNISKHLEIPTYKDSQGKEITAVEMVYGDTFNPSQLPDEFFWSFEDSMRKIDDQRIIAFFGKTKKGMYNLQEFIQQALSILDKCFRDWIVSIAVGDENPGFKFSDDCYFINFNYTDTLQKRFGVKNVYHIHGEVADGESLIFGHSSHPEIAFSELMEQKFIHHIGFGKSKRLMGLYMVEDVLYETDKHVQDNIDDLCMFMTLDGLHIEDIENIYVLGWAMAEVDYEYAKFFGKAMCLGCDYDKLSAIGQLRKIAEEERLDEDSLLDLIQLNIAYATKHRERNLGKGDLLYPNGRPFDPDYPEKEATEAVRKRFLLEQSGRTKQAMRELAIIKGKEESADHFDSILKLAAYLDGGHDDRKANAKWYISYHSDADRKHFEEVMKRVGVTDYKLYSSIEDCIERFRVE